MANQLKVTLDGENVLTDSVLPGINKLDVLSSEEKWGQINWTATEDCIVFTLTQGNYMATYVDGISVWCSSDNRYTDGQSAAIPLKKGQTITVGSAETTKFRHYKAFGLKRH